VQRFTGLLIHRNASDSLLGVLDSWLLQAGLERLIVVDNGSGADHLKAIREAMTAHAGGPVAIELLEAGGNLGFGPGANAGLRHWLTTHDTQWVALAPHDAAPADDCLALMGAALGRRPRAGLACADVGDGSIPVMDPYFGGLVMKPRSDAGVPGPDGWEEVDYPHGTLMVARRATLEEVGLFDERYFAYCEEADLGIRARRHHWRVGLVRGARVTNTHLGSSVALVDYLQHRNTLLLVRTHSGRYHAFIRLLISAYQLLDGSVRPTRRPLVFDAAARRDGVSDYLRHRFGPPPSRYLGR
jgi:N-acetylglucosaminyl-diphospho-decaprenol L-rhamnosyltransferase